MSRFSDMLRDRLGQSLPAISTAFRRVSDVTSGLRASTKSLPREPGVGLLGNLGAMRRDRHGFQVDFARKHPLAWASVGMFDVLVASDPEFVHEVLVGQSDAFGKAPGLSVFARPLLGDGLLTSEGSFHTRQRRLMAPMFVQRRIAGFAEVMVERATKLAGSLQQGQRVDVAALMMQLTLEIVGKTLLDAEVGSQAAEIGEALTVCLQHVVQATTSVVPIPPSLPTPANRRYRRAIARLDQMLSGVIDERRREGRDHGDLLSMLLAAQHEDDGSALPDRQLRDELMTAFLAGHETTANALAWTYYLLAQHPSAHAKMLEEVSTVLAKRPPTLADLPKLTWTLQVLKESMRLYPPAYVVGRRAIRTVEVRGHTVPKGTIVLINIAGIHRSPRFYERPDEFDPGRFRPDLEKKWPRMTYLPFGGGSRICIGNHFAWMEAHLTLTVLAQHLRFELPPGVRVKTKALLTLRPVALAGHAELSDWGVGRDGGIPMTVRRLPEGTPLTSGE